MIRMPPCLNEQTDLCANCQNRQLLYFHQIRHDDDRRLDLFQIHPLGLKYDSARNQQNFRIAYMYTQIDMVRFS